VLAFIRKESPELEELTSRLMTVIRTRRTTGLIDPEETIATSKERLFEAITQVLLFLSQEAPVVLLLDDLQWADSGSLQLFHYMTRSAQERRLLILGTYRMEDLLPEGEGASHPLVDTIQA
jgi:predicted ATPase